MNTRILLLALSAAALSSCSSVYKSGQTPDDVYYSPSRVQAQADNGDSYVDVRQEKQGTNYQSYEQYQDSYRDDRFLRMSIGNPYYLNSYNTYSGFDWRYNSFYDGFNYGFSSPWNNYFARNNFYNPYALSFGSYYGGGYYGGSGGYGGAYYGGGVKYTTTATPISRPVVFSSNSYSNSNRPAVRSNMNSSYYNNSQRYNNNNGNANSRNNNRSYYYNNNSNNNSRSSYTPANSNSSNNNNYTPSRSYTPASPSPSSSGGSSSGGGGGAVSRPTRGN